MEKETYYFISDAHLGSTICGDADREEKLIEFCRSIADSASHLYLVGDIFDFWFEYRHVIPLENFKILFEFHKLIESGTKITYICGNHDFWSGDFLTKSVGIEIHRKPITVNIESKSIYITHGDGFVNPNFGYRLTKFILNSKIDHFFYKLIHPNIGIPLGKWISKQSRHKEYSKEKMAEIHAKYRDHAFEFMTKNSHDALITGHTHRSDYSQRDGKTYINTGNWLHDFNYTTLNRGIFKNETFK